MPRARALLVFVLLLSYGAVGARQPAVRAAVRLPVDANALAAVLSLPSADPSTILLQVVRTVYDGPDARGTADGNARAAIRKLLAAPHEKGGDAVPLPLDPSIWRETILRQNSLPDDQLVAAILNDRPASLLYYGLSALDDETLAWLGPDRDTLVYLQQRAPIFATFGRSIKIRGGRVVVPGGTAAEPLWQALTGVEPARPAAFIQRLFRDDDARLAFLYDAIAHVDEPHQRYALGLQLPESSRNDRLRALLDSFSDASWHPLDRPFSRPMIDGSLLLSTLAVGSDGEAAGPMTRRIWERVFRNDELLDVAFNEVQFDDGLKDSDSDSVPVDLAWLAARISKASYTIGRRRLDTVLFAQRAFPRSDAGDAGTIATALRGFASFPALMLTLERAGMTRPAVLAMAAAHAQRLNTIESLPARRVAILQFQGVLGIIARAQQADAISAGTAGELVSGLCALDVSPSRGYEGRLAQWIRGVMVSAMPPAADDGERVESTVLSAMAGVGAQDTLPTIDWEGQRYRVDAAGAELRRLRRIREQQGGMSLDQALGSADDPAAATPADERTVAETLVSILYAASLGDPNAQAVTAGNAALRHDLGIPDTGATPLSNAAWRLPTEQSGGAAGWRVHGSVLGLETALGRLALRRMDPAAAPAEPRSGNTEQQVVALTAALSNPFTLSDHGRDEIAATLGRGRARLAALASDPAQLESVARDAGLSEWRRQALAWTLERRGAAAAPLSLLELFWLGGPRASALRALDAWGAATLPLTGCMCLRMPNRGEWEETSGRPLAGVLATRAADIPLQVAETLAALHLPASLASGILAFAMHDAAARAQPGRLEDWSEFTPNPAPLPADRFSGYIAALTAGGPLLLDDAATTRH